jgi:hypothetical protein
MTIRLTTLVLALIAIISASAAMAQVDGLALMKVEPNARPAGMGGAFTAVTTGPDGVWSNPASGWDVADVAGSFSHTAYWENVRLESGFLAMRLTKKLVMHVGLRYATVDNIEKRTVVPTEEPLAMFDANDASIKLGGVYQINDRIAAGAAAGWFFEKIDEWSGWAFNVDLGVTARAAEHVSVGASVTNLGSDFTLSRSSYDATDPISLPTTYRAGVAYTIDRYLATADLVYLDDEAHVQLGVEGRLHELFQVRTGYMVNYDTKNFTAGASFVQRNLTVDYAFVPYTKNLGTTHVFNLTFTL